MGPDFVVGELVAECTFACIAHNLLQRCYAHVAVGDERNSVLDAKLPDQLRVGSFVIIVVPGEDIDHKIEAVFFPR